MAGDAQPSAAMATGGFSTNKISRRGLGPAPSASKTAASKMVWRGLGPAPSASFGYKFALLAVVLSAGLPAAVGQLTVPGAPSAAELSVVSGESLRLEWVAPLTDGGAAVSSYQVEWDTNGGTQEVQAVTTANYVGANELQTITTTADDIDEIQYVHTGGETRRETQTITTSVDGGSTLGGTFSLQFDTRASGGSLQYSGEISASAPAESGRASVKEMLEAMPNIGDGGVYGVTRTVESAAEERYTWTVTFAASLGNAPMLALLDSSALTPAASGADVAIATVADGNVVRGSFRLTFEGDTTASLAHDASAAQVREALEALDTVGTVYVERLASHDDDQQGHTWAVTFVSDENAGNVEAMVPVFTDTLYGTNGAVYTNVTTPTDGNELGGTFKLSYRNSDESAAIAFDATAADVVDALTALHTVPAGAIAVSRSGPNYERGYVWTVSFLQDYNRTFEGDLDPLVSTVDDLTGTRARATVRELRKGTVKEVQQIRVETDRTDGVKANSTYIYLEFRGAVTGAIPVWPEGGADPCDRSTREVQTITVATTDTTDAGGDDTVSSLTYFSISYGAETTAMIQANPAVGDCSYAAGDIESELEKFDAFYNVDVTYDAISDTQGCTWSIEFVSSIGNLDMLKVTAVWADTDVDGPAQSVAVGDDAVMVCDSSYDAYGKCVNGDVDIFKSELEQLSTVGTVTVESYGEVSADDECVWRITFDSNAGNLTQMHVALTNDTWNDNAAARFAALNYGWQSKRTLSGGATSVTDGVDKVTVSTIVDGTSEALGGDFALDFRGQRTGYIAFDASAHDIETALESLSTIGSVDVVRSDPDENGGYTWSVTFLTNLGDVGMLGFDALDLTGTVSSGTVGELAQGAFPPFDSLDVDNGLPLGSVTVTDLSDLALDVTGLEQGIAYYFRVFAVNALGQSEAAMGTPPFALPMPQQPGAPTNFTLYVLDGTSLRAAFGAPALDGGDEVDKFQLEYATTAFDDEVQSVRVSLAPETEVQVVTSDTQILPEVQLVHLMVDSYAGADYKNEIQTVKCQATGGSFTLTFDGYETASIAYDADADAVAAYLMELTSLSRVNVTYGAAAYQACQPYVSGQDTSLHVEFIAAASYVGDMPMLVATQNELEGERRVDVVEDTQGAAPLDGTFRLTFRGATTAAIDHDASAKTVKARLEDLDTIQIDGVNVTKPSSDSSVSNYFDPVTTAGGKGEVMWAVTFVGSGVGGNVEALTVLPGDDELTGSNVSIGIYTDGSETLTERRSSSSASSMGNELGGTFTLTLRGHTTEPIEFNAATSTMKTRLEGLSNVGVVDVQRSAPSKVLGYAWTISFTSNPGYFPVNSRDVDLLVADVSDLTGNYSAVSAETTVPGTDPLGGVFQLAFYDQTNGGYNVTDELEADISAAGLKAELEALDLVGTVGVERATNVDGYTWLVTFGGCAMHGIVDVCNTGNVPLMGALSRWNNLTGGNSTPSVVVSEVLRGSGAGACDARASGECVDTITDLTSGEPFTYDITGLATGVAVFARVKAHNSLSYGPGVLPLGTEYNIPANVAPGAPTPVRLVESTSTTITVEWDYPTVNGGALVMGFELWMDDWSGGYPRMVFDGTDQPDATIFTVRTSTSLGVESGRQYRFTARAINYCSAADPTLACYGDFSDVSYFTVRAPRAPLPPPVPARDSFTSVGSQQILGDASITVDFFAPDDNGGSPITSYQLYTARPGGNFVRDTTMLDYPSIDAMPSVATNTSLRFRYTVEGLTEGELYRFYVVAINEKGRSAKSPVMSTLAASVPGRDADGNHTYALAKPSIDDVEATAIDISWDSPPPNSTGHSPITGYKVYMYPGVALNSVADPEPVKQEVQRVYVSVIKPQSEVQTVYVQNAVNGGNFRLYVLGRYTRELSTDSTGAEVAAAIQAAFGNGVDDVGTVVGYGPKTEGSDANSNFTKAWNITFTGHEGPVDAMVVEDSKLRRLDDSYGVSSWVARTVEGTTELGGTFTVAFDGAETVPLPYNLEADEMKRALENLDTISVVSVTKNESEWWGSAFWDVTFATEAGDLPLMVTTAGRLLNGNYSASLPSSWVETVQAGSPAVLVYDGTDDPETRVFTAAGLTEDALYAFKVQPLNLVDRGILSGATPTVAARAGASAGQTTAQGGALAVGMAGVIYEQQVIVAQGWSSQTQELSLRFEGGNWTSDLRGATAEEFADALSEEWMGIGDVHVTRSNASHLGSSGYSYTVTFLEQIGDVELLELNLDTVTTGDEAADNLNVTEFLKGAANEFTIEPKKATGAPVRDRTAAKGFAGGDVFFTEMWHPTNASWYVDGGVAKYNPVIYEIQRVILADATPTANWSLTLDLTNRADGYVETTEDIPAEANARHVKYALEELAGIEAVDVTRGELSDADDRVFFDITFTHNLGDMPQLLLNSGEIDGETSSGLSSFVRTVVQGVTEIQTVTTSCDEEFVFEEQTLLVPDYDFNFTLYLDDEYDTTISLTAESTAAEVEAALEATAGIYDVTVTKSEQSVIGRDAQLFSVTFIDPVGDIADLSTNSSWISGKDEKRFGTQNHTVTITEVVKGVSSLGGTFTLAYESAYTVDLDFDASASDVKAALEDLATIEEVDVAKENLGSGHRYTVTFTKDLGDLPIMASMPYRFEEQTIRTTGGDPTPLGGAFELSYNGASTGPIAYDASAAGVKAALEALPTLDRCDVARDVYDFGQFAWRVTIRSEVGDLPLILADGTELTGSDAAVGVTEVVGGDAASLTGENPLVLSAQKVAGLPSYTGQYVPASVGEYELRVAQLVQGGLAAQYWDNQWLLGTASLERVDPTVSFDWGVGAVTTYARDYVSARWSGKLRAPSSETFTLYVQADDGVRLYVDHVLLVDTWDSPVAEMRAHVALVEGDYHDIVLEWKEETGAASVLLEYSSYSVRRQVVPAAQLYYAMPIAGSPWEVAVLPGRADYPWSLASGASLTAAVAGVTQTFTIQARDAMGNDKITSAARDDAADEFTVMLADRKSVV